MPIRYSSVVGGSSGTGFNLDVGSSGNTTFYFDAPQPAGGYSITSQAADTSIEFYAIAEDGTLSGYTNTKALSATADFDTLVVYGAITNDLITFEYKSTTLPTASGDQDSGAAPFIASISDADLANIDDTTIITGGNFATDVVVTFTGTDSVVRSPKSVVRTNSTQLIVTRPDEILEDNAPYVITISNPNIPQSAYQTFTSFITAGGDPVWVTESGALQSAALAEGYSQTVSATDPDGATISYSIVSGSLPTGLSIDSSTGEISGTATTEGQFSFTLQASDPVGNVTNRAFSINSGTASGGTVTDANGYRTHTFTENGTFTVFGSSKTFEVEMLGGGGGGSSGFQAWAFGGGGGSYLVATYEFSGDTSITVGAAGIAQTACNNAAHAINGKGGDSVVGTLVAAGGSGGTQTGESSYGPGGGIGLPNTTTGAASVIKNYTGGNGNGGGDNLSSGGSNGLNAGEGDSTYGSGAAGTPNYTPGIHATGNGNGGGGGASCQNGHRGGGNGSPGIVKIRYAL